jgi:hypothetical protein
MEVDEGFIVGVYNYCHRWCETCPFTSRCRLFADGAEDDAAADGDLKLLRETPPHPTDVRAPNPWLEEILAGIDETKLEEVPEPQPLPARMMRVVAASHAYCERVWTAVDRDIRPNDDPYSIIQWYSHFIPAKVHRALRGLHEFDGCRDYPPDHEGSAKVALIAIDHSMQAWVDAQSIGRVSSEVAVPFVEALHQISVDLEELIPRAREFVRPGFDEPDEVRKLESTDWS